MPPVAQHARGERRPLGGMSASRGAEPCVMLRGELIAACPSVPAAFPSHLPMAARPDGLISPAPGPGSRRTAGPRVPARTVVANCAGSSRAAVHSAARAGSNSRSSRSSHFPPLIQRPANASAARAVSSHSTDAMTLCSPGSTACVKSSSRSVSPYRSRSRSAELNGGGPCASTRAHCAGRSPGSPSTATPCASIRCVLGLRSASSRARKPASRSGVWTNNSTGQPRKCKLSR